MPKIQDVPETKAQLKKNKKKEGAPIEREIVYPNIVVTKCLGDTSLTIDQIKELLGWEEVEGNEYQILDRNRKKINCRNNDNNRPINESRLASIVADKLEGRWYFNGQPVIIGDTGQILDGQKRLIAHVFAEQERQLRGAKYQDRWPTPITMETVLVYGVKSEDKVIDTIDTNQERSLADVLYRSPWFKRLSPSARQKVSRICQYAIRMLWQRTGAVQDAFAVFRTNPEMMIFLERHPRLAEACVDVFEENQKESLSKLLSLGYLSALYYLFATDKTAEESYFSYNETGRSEQACDMSHWEKAGKYIRNLSAGTDNIQAVRRAMAGLNSEDGEMGGTQSEKMAILIKGWLAYRDNGEVTDGDVELQYKVEGVDKVRTLIEFPTVGGIDRGGSNRKSREEVDEDGDPVTDPTPEEIEERKNKEKRRKEQAAKILATRGNNGRMPGEVKSDPITYDKDGKPPINRKKSPMEQEHDNLQFLHEGKVLIYESANYLFVYGADSVRIGKSLKITPKESAPNFHRIRVEKESLPKILAHCPNGAMRVSSVDGASVVTPIEEDNKKEETPKKTPTKKVPSKPPKKK